MRFGWDAKWVLVATGILWVAAICIGLRKILDYEYTPGVAATAPSDWPRQSQLRPAAGRATLVLLAHPHCPCTRASIGELALLMTRCQGKLAAYVLFYRPKEFEASWARSDLWGSAARIPGVTVIEDADGVEAGRFHGATSGQALLYDARGRLLFSGGITESRGHAGENEGRDAVVSLVTHGRATQTRTVVFGCALFDQTSQPFEDHPTCRK